MHCSNAQQSLSSPCCITSDNVVLNRFGSTEEVGIFELTNHGLTPLLDPAAFLKDKRVGGAACATGIVMEGNRAVLVEIQVRRL